MRLQLILLLGFLTISSFSYAQSNKEKSDAYFKTANVFFDENDFTNAIVYCDSAILANTENLEAYAYRGVCKFSLKDYDKAIEDFDLALILNPGYAEMYYYRGICKMELGASDQACEDWYKAYNQGYKKVMQIIEKNCITNDSIK